MEDTAKIEADISIDALNNILKTTLVASIINTVKQFKDASKYDNAGLLLLITYLTFTIIGYWTLFTVYHKDYYNKVKLEAWALIKDYPLKLVQWRRNEMIKYFCLALNIIIMIIFPFFIFNDDYQHICYVLLLLMGILDLLWMHFFIKKLGLKRLKQMTPAYASFDIQVILGSVICIAIHYEEGTFKWDRFIPFVSLLFLIPPCALLIREWKNKSQLNTVE